MHCSIIIVSDIACIIFVYVMNDNTIMVLSMKFVSGMADRK